jgi:hypothetical protein
VRTVAACPQTRDNGGLAAANEWLRRRCDG